MKHKVFLSLLLSAVVLSGCSSADSESVSESVSESEISSESQEAKKYDLTIGSENPKSTEILLENNLSQAVKGMKVSTSEAADAEYTDNLFKSDEELAKGQTLEWFYTPQDTSAESDSTAQDSTADENKSKTIAVLFTLADDSTLTLREFDYQDADGVAKVNEKDGICYVTYKSKATGEEVDTFEKEQQLSNEAGEAVNETEDASADQEQNADNQDADADVYIEESYYEEPVYEEPVYQEQIYEEPVYDEPVYQEPVYEEPAYQEPVYQEPAAQEPVYQEPVYEEPAVQEPAVQEPATQTPAVDQQTEGCLSNVEILE